MVVSKARLLGRQSDPSKHRRVRGSDSVPLPAGGTSGAQSAIGYARNPNFGAKLGEQWHTIDQATYSLGRYAQFAREWLDLGAQIVGGCCATGPEHIAAMVPLVVDRRHLAHPV